MTTQAEDHDSEPTDRPSGVSYRARCPICPWTGRQFDRYAHAEDAARDHARLRRHETHVIDHYGMRVVGSTQQPGGAT